MNGNGFGASPRRAEKCTGLHCRSALPRLLGAAHIAVAIILLPASTFFGYISIIAMVPALVWLIILGLRLWRTSTGAARVLRVTHLVLAPLAVLLVLYGLYALHAARQSAVNGGGLLGAFGLIPIVMGLLAGGLSLVSLCVSASSIFQDAAASEAGSGSGTGKPADARTSPATDDVIT